MEIAFLPLDLARWDQATGDLLVVGIWSDLRPLHGAAGLLDWRLCGRLSSWIMTGHLAGSPGEQLLFPGGRRVPWPSVLAIGQGARAEFDEARFRACLRQVWDALRGLKSRRMAIALPGRESEGIAARRSVELLTQLAGEIGGEALLDELTIIEPPASQKEMSEALRRRVR